MIARAVATVFGLANGAVMGGVLLFVSVDEAVGLTARQSIGSETVVSGITVGAVLGGVVAGVGLLAMAWKVGVQFGSDVTKFKEAADKMTQAAPIVSENTAAISALNDRLERAEAWQREYEPVVLEWKRRMSA